MSVLVDSAGSSGGAGGAAGCRGGGARQESSGRGAAPADTGAAGRGRGGTGQGSWGRGSWGGAQEERSQGGARHEDSACQPAPADCSPFRETVVQAVGSSGFGALCDRSSSQKVADSLAGGGHSESQSTCADSGLPANRDAIVAGPGVPASPVDNGGGAGSSRSSNSPGVRAGQQHSRDPRDGQEPEIWRCPSFSFPQAGGHATVQEKKAVVTELALEGCNLNAAHKMELPVPPGPVLGQAADCGQEAVQSPKRVDVASSSRQSLSKSQHLDSDPGPFFIPTSFMKGRKVLLRANSVESNPGSPSLGGSNLSSPRSPLANRFSSLSSASGQYRIDFPQSEDARSTSQGPGSGRLSPCGSPARLQRGGSQASQVLREELEQLLAELEAGANDVAEAGSPTMSCERIADGMLEFRLTVSILF